MNSVWNRSGRRSGGYRHFTTKFGTNVDAVKKDLSIQCFEQRHKDCTGTDPFFGFKCECKCHQRDHK